MHSNTHTHTQTYICIRARAHTHTQQKRRQKKKHSTLRCGYYQSDKIFIGIIGINAGYISVLISALYLNSEKVIIFYKNQELLWIGVIILLFWINWIWLKVYRNLIDQDPVLFTLKDPVSIITGTILLIVFLFAS